MNAFSKAFGLSMQGLRSQSQRLQVVSENIANSDTPGYRRKIISFSNAFDEAGQQNSRATVSLDSSELARVHDPAHPLADPDGYFQGSNVDLIVEIADAREAQRSYEANLKLFDQTRKMSSSLLELLRK